MIGCRCTAGGAAAAVLVAEGAWEEAGVARQCPGEALGVGRGVAGTVMTEQPLEACTTERTANHRHQRRTARTRDPSEHHSDHPGSTRTTHKHIQI